MSLEIQTTSLHLEPNFKTNEINRTTKIAITQLEPTSKIVLHSKIISIKEVFIIKNKQNIFDSFTINEDNDLLVLTLREETTD